VLVPSHHLLIQLSAWTGDPRVAFLHRFKYSLVGGDHQQFFDAVECLLGTIVAVAIEGCLAFGQGRAG